MNNQELELKVKELLAIDNFFDMIIAVKEFEKDYKGSDFYKVTKMPLSDVIKSSKMWYTINVRYIADKVQHAINTLDFTNLMSAAEKVGSTFQQENTETLELLNMFKDIVK